MALDIGACPPPPRDARSSFSPPCSPLEPVCARRARSAPLPLRPAPPRAPISTARSSPSIPRTPFSACRQSAVGRSDRGRSECPHSAPQTSRLAIPRLRRPPGAGRSQRSWQQWASRATSELRRVVQSIWTGLRNGRSSRSRRSDPRSRTGSPPIGIRSVRSARSTSSDE